MPEQFVAVYLEKKKREGEIKQSRQKVNHNFILAIFFLPLGLEVHIVTCTECPDCFLKCFQCSEINVMQCAVELKTRFRTITVGVPYTVPGLHLYCLVYLLVQTDTDGPYMYKRMREITTPNMVSAIKDHPLN